MPYSTGMPNLIRELGGVPEIARALNIKPPSVYGWAGRIPPERCPDLEKWKGGAITCEQMRPDIRWYRIPDASWIYHPVGRPVRDVSIGLIEAAATSTAADTSTGAAQQAA